MKYYLKYILGFVLIFIGIVLSLNAFGLTDVNIFFKGWWTLFIIIPSLIGISENKDKTTSVIFLVIGIWLFLAERDLIEFGLLLKLLLPIILITIGLLLVFKDVLDINSKDIDKLKKDGNSNKQFAFFGSQDLKFKKEKVKNMNLNSIFGAITLDLRDAIIEKDIVIDSLSIFGGIDIYVPKNCKVKVKSTPIFGGVDIKNKELSDDGDITIYLNSICIFGGVDIK